MKSGWLRIYTYAYLMFLYAPVVLLPLFAFNSGTIISFPLQGFTTKWFAELATIPALHSAVKNSLIIAVSSAVLATTLGIFVARATTRYKFPGKGGMVGLIMLPLVLPEVIIAVSLLVVLLTIGLPLAFWTVILGHVLICTPYAVVILTSAFQSLDRSLEEAAYDLGEGKWSTFRLVIMPLVAPGIVSSLLIAFTVSLDEFIIAYFLSGAEATLPVYIFSQFRFPAKVPVIMALGTILVVLSILLITIAEIYRRRGIARRGGKDTGGFL